MEMGGLIGIAVAIALSIVWTKKRPAVTPMAMVGRGLTIMVVAGVAAAGGVLGAQYLRHLAGPTQADVDREMQVAQGMPLFGLVLEEHPELKVQLRQIVEAEMKNPTKSGPTRTNQFGVDMRKRYVTPMLLKADDQSAIKASLADADLVVQLQKSNVATCQEFGLSGLSRPDKLDRESAALFKQVLAAREVAYRSGEASKVERKQLTMDQLGEVLALSGYTEADFDQLTKIDKLSTADACAATVKLYSAPKRLPPDKAADLSRFLLAAGG